MYAAPSSEGVCLSCVGVCLRLCAVAQARVYSESTSDADLEALRRQIVWARKCCPSGGHSVGLGVARPDTELLGVLDYLTLTTGAATFSAPPPKNGHESAVST